MSYKMSSVKYGNVRLDAALHWCEQRASERARTEGRDPHPTAESLLLFFHSPPLPRTPKISRQLRVIETPETIMTAQDVHVSQRKVLRVHGHVCDVLCTLMPTNPFCPRHTVRNIATRGQGV